MIRPREVDYLESEHLGAVIVCVSEGDTQSNPPEGD
jgi:hypothetical protein